MNNFDLNFGLKKIVKCEHTIILFRSSLTNNFASSKLISVFLPGWTSWNLGKTIWNECVVWAFFLPPPNKVWGKVVFLHLSVILFTGGCIPECNGTGGVCLVGGVCPGGVYHPYPQRRLLMRAVCILLECILVFYQGSVLVIYRFTCPDRQIEVNS